MKRWMWMIIVAGGLASCSGPHSELEVTIFDLKDTRHEWNEDAMIRSEKQQRLHGAISMAEQKQRLGQYYTARWKDNTGTGPVEIVMVYQQSSSASKLKKFTKSFPADSTKGVAEFNVLGENFIKYGTVLSWRISLRRNGREIAHEQSYLWH